MTPTLATPSATAHDGAPCPGALNEVISGPWDGRNAGRPHQALPFRVQEQPAAATEWYARPLVVATGVVAACTVFWSVIAFGAVTVF